MVIKVFTSKNCVPCHEVAELIKQGRYDGEVQVVDVESDEGFEMFTKEVLSGGDGAVPSAYRDGEKCAILLDEEENKLIFECPESPPC